MTEEEKLYYETLFEERKQELLNLIKRFNINIFKLNGSNKRPTIRSIKDDAYRLDTLHIWLGTSKIYIDTFKKIDEEKLFELYYLPETDGNHRIEVYKLFCIFFKRLVDKNKGEF